MKTAADIGWRLNVELGPGARHFSWLKARKSRITGSKIADIMGDGYNDVHDRYRIERGEMAVGGSALAIRRGQLMEPEILKIAQADNWRPGYFETLATPRFLTMPGEDWIGCSPDFLATSNNPAFCELRQAWPVRIFGEIKSRDSRAGSYYRDGQCKPSDVWQVRWGCMVTDADVGLLVVHLGSAPAPEYRIIERDDDVERLMVAAAQTFRDAVAVGDLGLLATLAKSGETRREIARERWADTIPEVWETDDPAVADIIARLERMKVERGELTDEMKSLEADIIDLMGHHEVMRAGKWRVRLPGLQKARRTFSRKMLAAALPHIDIEPFYVESDPAPRGRMTIKEMEDGV